MKDIWYIVVRDEKDINKKPYVYPLNIYADKTIADTVAHANGYRVIPVVPLEAEG